VRRGSTRTVGWAALLVAATVLAYAPTLGAGFVWDDDDYVTANPLLWEPDGLHRIWLSMDAPSQYFPLTYTSFRIEHALWGLEPAGYHAVNVLLHAANALLVWLLLRRLGLPGAFLAAAIFALHPVQVESVAWITERKNLLSLLFSLCALLAWLRFCEPGACRPALACAGSFGLYALALAAKTTACTLPAARTRGAGGAPPGAGGCDATPVRGRPP
jgi:predicted membrane-bound mannosyltransferase